MISRSLGKSGLLVFPLVFGGNVFGWTADELMSFRLLDACVDGGINLIDTANIYSSWAPGNTGGESETIIGKWLKRSKKRNRVLIATKVGMEVGHLQKGLSKPQIFRAVEESLHRLQIETIDLYQSHIDDPATPVTETLEAYTQLIQEGKVRAIGASQYTPQRLMESFECSRNNNLATYTCLQPRFNLYDREEFETEFANICGDYDLGVIGFYALAAGFLTGKYRVESDLTKSVRGSTRVKNSYFNEKGLRILSALDEVAAMTNAPMASVAISWILHQPRVTAPIASAVNLDQLKSLFLGVDLKLGAESLEILNNASNYRREIL